MVDTINWSNLLIHWYTYVLRCISLKINITEKHYFVYCNFIKYSINFLTCFVYDGFAVIGHHTLHNLITNSDQRHNIYYVAISSEMYTYRIICNCINPTILTFFDHLISSKLSRSRNLVSLDNYKLQAIEIITTRHRDIRWI